MNRLLESMIAIMMAFPLTAVAVQNASEESAEPPSVPASVEATSAAKVPTDQPPLKPGSDNVKAQAQGTTAAPQSTAAEAGTEEASKDDKPVEPITGAFGVPLGEPFKPSMVEKVLSEQEQGYRGPDGAELTGSLVQFEPREPEERFQHYSLKTTDTGIVYVVQGNYQYQRGQESGKQEAQEKQEKAAQAKAIRATCKAAVKALAGELEASYGKPRGKGWGGEWFSFRQISATDNKSIRLYAHRCRSGIYSIVYSDEQVLRGLPGKAAAPPEAGVPAVASPPTGPEAGAESESLTDTQSPAKH